MGTQSGTSQFVGVEETRTFELIAATSVLFSSRKTRQEMEKGEKRARSKEPGGKR